MKALANTLPVVIVTLCALFGIFSVFTVDAAREDEAIQTRIKEQRTRVQNDVLMAAIDSAQERYGKADWHHHITEEYQRLWGVPYGTLPNDDRLRRVWATLKSPALQ